MLTQRDVPRYLLALGLLSPEAVLDHDLVIRDASSRNRNYRAETTNGPAYLLKQAIGADTRASVANEAAVYAELSQDSTGLSNFLPRFYGFDSEEDVLVLELIRDAQDLRTYQAQPGRLSTGAAGSLGTLLGRLHRQTLRPAAAAPTQAASVLSLHRPDVTLFRDVSAASLELVRI